MKRTTFLLLPFLLGLLLTACEPEPVNINNNPLPVTSDARGMYILNEGGYNQNNASLDYLDFTTGQYSLNIFQTANPSLVQGLGDVGNDLLVYGNKVYICVNGSGLIEVVEAYTAKHIAQINIANCRRLCVDDGYVYVTSYAGRVEDADHQLGYVAKIDTATLQVVATCEVGYQPEGLAVVEGKLYVANSGGYMGMNTGVYDNRVSVISLNTFQRDTNLIVDYNPQEIIVDSRHQLWISTYGNYYDVPSNLYRLDPTTEIATAQGVEVTKMAIKQDTLIYYATTYDALWNPTTSFYQLVTATGQVLPLTLSQAVASPYGIGLNPTTGELYISDAGDYVNPGSVSCFQSNGSFQWKLYAGVVPSRFAFVY